LIADHGVVALQNETSPESSKNTMSLCAYFFDILRKLLKTGVMTRVAVLVSFVEQNYCRSMARGITRHGKANGSDLIHCSMRCASYNFPKGVLG
jgi:hypothetical protein